MNMSNDATFDMTFGEVISTGGVTSHKNLTDRDADDQHPISAITGLQDALDGKQATGSYATTQELTAGLALKADAELLTAYATLIDLANGLAGKANINDLAAVASSGDYDDLLNKPELFSGDYNDLANKPTLFSGNYTDLINKPDLSIYAVLANLANVATSGNYADLLNKPNLFSGDYNDLSNKPDLSVYALISSLASIATSGDYNDLSNKPTIPTVPTNVSAFNNDSGYLTLATLPIYDGTVVNGGA